MIMVAKTMSTGTKTSMRTELIASLCAVAGCATVPPKIERHATLDMALISPKGETVELSVHLAKSKVTVFDFYADWCGPCKDVDKFLLERLEAGDNIAVRKLNVVDWDTSLALDYLGKVDTLPYVIVYSAQGKEVDRISGLDLKRLQSAIEAGR